MQFSYLLHVFGKNMHAYYTVAHDSYTYNAPPIL